MPERCLACPRAATHTLQWHTARREWRVRRLDGTGARPHRSIHRYCLGHATDRAARRNALGVLPAMQRRRESGAGSIENVGEESGNAHRNADARL